LAAALPDARVDLIESAARKCEVIDRLAAAAALENTRSVAQRAEEWAAGEGATAYDAVVARAVAPLAVLAEYAAPLLRVEGDLVAWKGRVDDVEEALRQHLTVVRGYLGLLLEQPGGQLDDEHWQWVERAYSASVDALELHVRAVGSSA
jgi:16S rRNA (guanine527-N7)-methyltransferase